MRTPAVELAKLFPSLLFPDFIPNYNIGPGRGCLVIRNKGDALETATPRWDLLPRFVADPKKCAKPINARAESVTTNGFFKGAFAHRRCLIPADGFYEPEENERDEKTGRWWYFRFEDDRRFSFAGLWETWGEGEEYLETFTLLTTDPMDVVARCGHKRSPLILPEEKYDLWLDPEAKPPQLKKLLTPSSSEEMVGYPVDGRAKNPRAAGPELIEPAR